MKVLHLTLKRQWFAAIADGSKVQEYRNQSEHWNRILGPHVDRDLPWHEVHFRNGYHSLAPFMRVGLLGLRVGPHNGRTCYILSLGPILEVKHYPKARA